MPEKTDELLEGLLQTSQGLSRAIARSDMELIADALQKRQELLDGFHRGSKPVQLTEPQKQVYEKILETDRQNMEAMRQWKSQLVQKADVSDKMGRGIVGYVKDNRNLSQGQMLNKKR